MHVLQTNAHGDYLALGSPNSSNYFGYYVREGMSYVKTLWNLIPDESLRDITLGTTITRTFPSAKQELKLFDTGVRFSCAGTQRVTLDCKRLYDESEEDRVYTVTVREEEGVRLIHVTYEKEGLHCVLLTTMDVELIRSWRQVEYPYDERRGRNSTRWVYDLARLSGGGRRIQCCSRCSCC